jgi:succinoglycan biosynthesis protein ExoA
MNSNVRGAAREYPAGVSVIMPVLNEEDHLEAAVRRVLAQQVNAPIEVILAVGPSRDATSAIAEKIALEDARVHVVDNPSGRTPSALNLAIATAQYSVIVRVDGHAELPDGYIATGMRLLEQTGADNVGGIMAAEGRTPFEIAVACAMTSPIGVGSARFHTGGQAGPVDTVYLGIFRRSALDRVGGYDERYTRAQDWEMNLRIRQSGGLIWFSPELQVSYRPRRSLAALALQYRDYGRWRRVVIRRHKETVSLRYLAPPVALLANLVGIVGALVSPWTLLIPATYALGVGAASLFLTRRLPIACLAWMPAVLATMHMAWGWGFVTSPRRLART